MRNVEELGRLLDRELEKLRQFFEQEVKPTTERELASVLRSTAQRLEELARVLEDRSPAGAPAKKAE